MTLKKVLILLIAVAVIIVLFFALKPQSKTDHNNQTTKNAAASQPAIRVFTLEIRNGQVVSGYKTLQVSEGDEVHITVTSNTDDELHLHGYDKEVELTAGQPGELTFTANLTGRFEAELHHLDKTVFVLEVQPRR